MENLKQKANELLDATAKEQEKYSNERILLYSILENSKDNNNKDLQQMLEIFSRLIVLESESEAYKNLKASLIKIDGQKTRKTDNTDTERLELFKVIDKNNEEYTFFSRDSAKKYMEKHLDLFENEEIQITRNNNMDLEKIIRNI